MKRGLFFLATLFVATTLFVGCDTEEEKWLPEGQMTVPLSENAGEAVDLGLSVLWADRYVGADSPEERGDYFAWGETEPKDWGRKEDWKFYGVDYADIPILIHGTEHDAARMNWGGKWRLPTMGEVAELKEKCTFSGNSSGCTVTGPNGNTIYFAETGAKFWDNDIIGHKIEDCTMWHSHQMYYWSLSYSSRWWCHYTTSSVHPENGYHIRPVMDK